MPFCVSCGKENKETAKFCTACGKVMSPQLHKTEPVKAMPVPDNKKSGTNLKNKLLIACIALLLLILMFWLWNKDDNKDKHFEQITQVSADTRLPTPTQQLEANRITDTIIKKDSPAKQPETNIPVDKIKDIIRQYYALISNNDCLSINAYYEPVLENYYNRINLNRSEVLNDCIIYNRRWPFNSTSVDYNSFQITNITNGGYLVTYHLSSSLRKKDTDDWKTFSLFITVHFTGDLKIKSIYEIKQ